METIWEGFKWGIGLFASVLVVVVILAIITTIYEEVRNKEMIEGKTKKGGKNGTKRKNPKN